MKILIIANSHGAGGGTTHFQLLTKFLAGEGHQVFAIGVGDEDKFLPEAEGLAGRARLPQTARGLGGKVKKAAVYLGIARQAKKFRPDLFLGIGYGKSYVRLAKMLKGSAFAFFQDLIYAPTPGDPLITSLVDAFDAVAVQSPAMVKPFLAGIPTDKGVRCLPCFGQPPVPGYLCRLPGPSENIRLAYFGRLAGNKGVAEFLRSFARVRKQAGMALDIYGSGPERGAIEQAVMDLQLQEAVAVRGPYPGGEDYARLLSQSHALVLPSLRFEGIPLVLLEAMSYGVPFLSTTIGAISDTAAGNPDVLVVDPSENSLAEGLLRLCNGLRTGRIDPARLQKYYQKHFSHDAIGSVWKEMLEDPRKFFAAAKESTR